MLKQRDIRDKCHFLKKRGGGRSYGVNKERKKVIERVNRKKERERERATTRVKERERGFDRTQLPSLREMSACLSELKQYRWSDGVMEGAD